MFKVFLVACYMAGAGVATAQVKQNIPVYDKGKLSVQQDWLLGVTDAKTNLYNGSDGQIVLSNGLVSRTFTTYPNVASVGLEELRSNTSFIRSVRPEAIVMIDGFTFDVGGLDGQKIHNYLLKEWVPELKANPMSFKMQGYVIEETKARFGWKKRPEWMPKDMPWPVPGKELIFTYKLDQKAIDVLAEKSKRDQNRKLLIEDKFQKFKVCCC